jgi:V8-like Glu-specific endopeptidase
MGNSSVWDSVRVLVQRQDLVIAVETIEEWLRGRLDGPKRVRVRSWLDELVLHVASARAVQIDKRKGLITPEQEGVRLRQISMSILSLVNEIEDEDLASSPTMPSMTAVPKSVPASTHEKIIGSKSNLQMLSWLERGLLCSTAVCRLVSGERLGTGFRVQNNLLVTNNHVIRTIAEARRFSAQFFFEERLDRSMKDAVFIETDPDRCFWTSDELDITIVGAKFPPNAATATIASVPLKDFSAVVVGDFVSIIQHPLGGPKQIALTSNHVINIYDHRIQYVTDTLPGSSGAPVFNTAWEIVAVHHAGGDLVSNSIGDSVFANEGISVASFVDLPDVRRVLSVA